MSYPEYMAADSEDLKLMQLFLEEEKQAIIDTQILKGLRASGQSADLLRVQSQGDVGQLIDGSGTFQEQEEGRGPGGSPPFKDIYNWLQFKKYGLNYKDDKTRSILAWILIKKIRQKGTHTYITGKPTGVLTDNLNQPNLDKLMDAFSAKYSTQVLSDVLNPFRK